MRFTSTSSMVGNMEEILVYHVHYYVCTCISIN